MKKNSFANTVIIWTYLRNTVSRYVLQYYAIIGFDKTSFFYINGNINPSKEGLKNQAV